MARLFFFLNEQIQRRIHATPSPTKISKILCLILTKKKQTGNDISL